MNGVWSGDSSRTSVPKIIMASYPSPPWLTEWPTNLLTSTYSLTYFTYRQCVFWTITTNKEREVTILRSFLFLVAETKWCVLSRYRPSAFANQWYLYKWQVVGAPKTEEPTRNKLSRSMYGIKFSICLRPYGMLWKVEAVYLSNYWQCHQQWRDSLDRHSHCLRHTKCNGFPVNNLGDTEMFVVWISSDNYIYNVFILKSILF